MNRWMLFLLFSWGALAADLSLEDAVSLALKHHPEAQMASLRIENAKADTRGVAAGLHPRIDLNGEYFPTKTFVIPANGVFSTRQNDAAHADISGSYPLWDFGRTKERYSASQSKEEEAFFYQRLTQNSLIGQVWLRYYGLAYMASLIDALEDSVRFYHAQRDQAVGMRQAGLKTEADEARFKASWLEAKERLATARAEYDKTRIALGSLIGSDEVIRIDKSILERGAESISFVYDLEKLKEQLSSNNPQLKALQASVRSAKALSGAADKEGYGSVSLVGLYGVDNSLSSYDSAQIGVKGTIPLYDGGRLNAEGEKSRIALSLAQKEYERVEKVLWEELYGACHDLKRSDETIASKQEVIYATQKALSLMEGRYKQGLATYVDVLESQSVLDNAKIASAEAKFRKIEAWVHIRRLLNKGCENDVCKK